MTGARAALAHEALASVPTNQDLDPDRLRTVFGIFPTGVVAVAAQVDGEVLGLAASSFTSVSLDPPLVSVSVAKTSQTWPTLRRARNIGVTILGDHQGLVARQLAGPSQSRFRGLDLVITDRDAVLIVDGLARLDTTIYREVEAGDHLIVLLELRAAEHLSGTPTSDTTSPLVFHGSTFRQLLPAAGTP